MFEMLAEQKVNFCFALGRQQLFRLPKLTGSSDADGNRQIARDKLRHDVRAYKHTRGAQADIKSSHFKPAATAVMK